MPPARERSTKLSKVELTEARRPGSCRLTASLPGDCRMRAEWRAVEEPDRLTGVGLRPVLARRRYHFRKLREHEAGPRNSGHSGRPPWLLVRTGCCWSDRIRR